ncbi:protein SERAC1-like [Saccoglossus kowalevskii]|uniref:Protein SERAC1 n=1 Tax=Saccoglossus kowalevskii TaxID=10224 RepID=A0ABM0GNM6_SACKO|nr:PREDICTED: protein SERAC1-like [Saccoglossus kowalevskii]
MRMLRVVRFLRRFSSSGVPPDKKSSRKFGRYILLGSAVVGGVALYNELNYLDNAVQYKVDTSDPEKWKTYIYIPGGAMFYQIKDTVNQMRLRSFGHLFEEGVDPDEASWWSRLEVKSDNPIKLLSMAQSNVKNIRFQGVNSLAKQTSWQDSEYRKVAQACDDRTRVALARTKGADSRFFLPPPKYHDETTEESIEASFRELLSALPMTGLDKCAQYFTSVAMKEDKTAMADVRGGLWCFGGNGLPFATTLSNIPDQKAELFYLQALLHHSEIPSHCDVIVEKNGLQLLMQLAEKREESLTIMCKICRILGNLALHEQLHHQIVTSGWVTLLASWMKSNYIPLAMHASRTLANLDRDFCSEKCESGIYIMHPRHRSSLPIAADVIFVHGLLGGSFKTWRQQDPERLETEEAPADIHNFKKRDLDLTYCWPKSWLAEDAPHTRIITVEYDTHVSNWMPKCPFETEKRTIASRSIEMLEKLKEAGVGCRPVIWVTHSMGGLLVKQMILDAQKMDDFKTLSDKTRGVVFYSTPHKGSPLAAYSQQAKYLLYPSVEVNELSPESTSLEEQHRQFFSFAKERKIRCLSFGETEPTNIGLGIKLLIVPPESANPGYGSFQEMDVNHLNVCKPDNIDSKLYKLLCSFIDELIPKKVIEEISSVLDPNKSTEEYCWGDMF